MNNNWNSKEKLIQETQAKNQLLEYLQTETNSNADQSHNLTSQQSLCYWKNEAKLNPLVKITEKDLVSHQKIPEQVKKPQNFIKNNILKANLLLQKQQYEYTSKNNNNNLNQEIYNNKAIISHNTYHGKQKQSHNLDNFSAQTNFEPLEDLMKDSNQNNQMNQPDQQQVPSFIQNIRQNLHPKKRNTQKEKEMNSSQQDLHSSQTICSFKKQETYSPQKTHYTQNIVHTNSPQFAEESDYPQEIKLAQKIHNNQLFLTDFNDNKNKKKFINLKKSQVYQDHLKNMDIIQKDFDKINKENEKYLETENNQDTSILLQNNINNNMKNNQIKNVNFKTSQFQNQPQQKNAKMAIKKNFIRDFRSASPEKNIIYTKSQIDQYPQQKQPQQRQEMRHSLMISSQQNNSKKENNQQQQPPQNSKTHQKINENNFNTTIFKQQQNNHSKIEQNNNFIKGDQIITMNQSKNTKQNYHLNSNKYRQLSQTPNTVRQTLNNSIQNQYKNQDEEDEQQSQQNDQKFEKNMQTSFTMDASFMMQSQNPAFKIAMMKELKSKISEQQKLLSDIELNSQQQCKKNCKIDLKLTQYVQDSKVNWNQMRPRSTLMAYHRKNKSEYTPMTCRTSHFTGINQVKDTFQEQLRQMEDQSSIKQYDDTQISVQRSIKTQDQFFPKQMQQSGDVQEIDIGGSNRNKIENQYQYQYQSQYQRSQMSRNSNPIQQNKNKIKFSSQNPSPRMSNRGLQGFNQQAIDGGRQIYNKIYIKIQNNSKNKYFQQKKYKTTQNFL